MNPQPRPYQAILLDEARKKLRKIKEDLKRRGINRGPRLLIQAATGAGKTRLASFITTSHLEKVANARVRFMAHRDFLVDQTSQTFEQHRIDHSYIANGRWMNEFSPAHVCMIPTVKNRIKRYTVPTLCIWDETHHIASKTWSAIMMEWESATHIGFSATPVRLDGKGLDAFYDDMICGPSVEELIRIGALSDYKYFAPSKPDLGKLHSRMGDYDKGEIDEEMSHAAVIGNLVEEYAKKARNKKAVYFCTSIKNSRETADAFNGAGFRFIHLDGTSSQWERQQAARAVATGDLDGMTNVDLFGEGFDLAAQAQMDVTIEVVGIARPTKSLGLSRQMVGRVLRPKPYPGIILDHAGHLDNFGLPDDEVEWSLAGAEQKEKSQTMQCQGCGAEIAIQSVVCKHCGHAPEAQERAPSAGGAREVEFKDGDLEEIDRSAIRKSKKIEEWQCGSLQELVDLGKRRGYQYPQEWAAKLWTEAARRKKAKEHADNQQIMHFEGVMK